MKEKIVNILTFFCVYSVLGWLVLTSIKSLFNMDIISIVIFFIGFVITFFKCDFKIFRD